MRAEPTTAPKQELFESLKDEIQEWLEISAWMAEAKNRELELRLKIAKALFKNPKEGVNRVLSDDLAFTLDHKINRKLDEAALDAVMAELPEDSIYRQVGAVVEYKPSLVLKGYRSMPEGEKLIFCQALTETPGTPTLKIDQLTDAMDPATSPAVADWPAQKVETPIMNRYFAAKEKTEAKAKPVTCNGKSRKPSSKTTSRIYL